MKSFVTFWLLLQAALFCQTPISSPTTPSCKQELAEIQRQLLPDSNLALRLKADLVGNGVHYAWMDEMLHYGIKRADLTFKSPPPTFESAQTTLVEVHYYFNYEMPLQEVPDGLFLSSVRTRGLEAHLKEAATSQYNPYSGILGIARLPMSSTIFTYTMFDSECLAPFYTAVTTNQPSNNALKYAIRKNDLALLKTLLAVGVDVDKEDDNDRLTALLFASSQQLRADNKTIYSKDAVSAVDFARELIVAGANVNARDNTGQTALMYAAWLGDADLVKLLLSAQADASVKDHAGKTALDYAVQKNYPNVIKLLKGERNRTLSLK